MSYSQLYTHRRFKIPTLAALVVVAAVVFVMGQYVFTGNIPFLRAAPPQVESVAVANRSPSGATIYWQTKLPTSGWVLFGESEGSLSTLKIDDRDSARERGKYLNHHVTIKTLKENQTYFYKLVVDNQVAGGARAGAFSFRTLEKDAPVSNLEPAYGRVLMANNTPLEGAVVLLQIGNAAPLSTISKSTGEWLIPLNYIVEAATSSLKAVTPRDSIRIMIMNDEGSLSQITTDLVHLSPLPEVVVINKNYDFTKNANVLNAVAPTAPRPTNTPLPPKPTLAPTKASVLSASSRRAAVPTPSPTPRRLLAQAVGAPTPTATLTPTATASPTVATSSASLTPTTPVAGAEITSFAFMSFALIVLGMGLLLAFGI